MWSETQKNYQKKQNYKLCFKINLNQIRVIEIHHHSTNKQMHPKKTCKEWQNTTALEGDIHSIHTSKDQKIYEKNHCPNYIYLLTVSPKTMMILEAFNCKKLWQYNYYARHLLSVSNNKKLYKTYFWNFISTTFHNI